MNVWIAERVAGWNGKLCTDAEHNAAYLKWFQRKRIAVVNNWEFGEPMPRRNG